MVPVSYLWSRISTAMALRLSLFALAALLLICVLASISAQPWRRFRCASRARPKWRRAGSAPRREHPPPAATGPLESQHACRWASVAQPCPPSAPRSARRRRLSHSQVGRKVRHAVEPPLAHQRHPVGQRRAIGAGHRRHAARSVIGRQRVISSPAHLGHPAGPARRSRGSQMSFSVAPWPRAAA